MTRNCSAIVTSPVDAAPMRSPQAVHTALLKHFAGREVIEIGTRNGDGMACFCQHTLKATAIELATNYCTVLRQRSEALKQAGGRGFEVLCSDYRKVPNLDADIFTWWQEPPHLLNGAALQSLRGFMLNKQIRPTAVAAMVFDPKFRYDLSDYRTYRQYAVGEGAWAEAVEVDEAALCCAKRKRKDPGLCGCDGPNPGIGCGGLCGRARGTFYTLGVPLMALVNHSFNIDTQKWRLGPQRAKISDASSRLRRR